MKNWGDEPRIELWLVNRARLALEMADPDFDGLVVWVNPAWVGDPHRERYLWTFPVMRDPNELISNIDNPITYRGPDSLKGLVFGGVDGYLSRPSPNPAIPAISCCPDPTPSCMPPSTTSPSRWTRIPVGTRC